MRGPADVLWLTLAALPLARAPALHRTAESCLGPPAAVHWALPEGTGALAGVVEDSPAELADRIREADASYRILGPAAQPNEVRIDSLLPYYGTVASERRS